MYEIIRPFQLNRYTQYTTYRTILNSWQFTSVKQNKIPVISDDTVLFGDIFLDIVSLFPFYCPNINPSSYIENIGLQLYSHGTLTLTQTSNNSDITRESTKGYKSRNQIYFFTASYTILQQLNKKMVPTILLSTQYQKKYIYWLNVVRILMQPYHSFLFHYFQFMRKFQVNSPSSY